ncbi:uncharacterized protein [Drosophila suzukii]|uniref:Retrotransposon gag domain-containing protein n=1 Tax=Drosophila suzukii TaxID=28584 RepID=A0ABM4TZV6_DROSZ
MLVDKMTKWGLSFDGTSVPLSFVEHIEERADTYRIDQKYLSHAIVVVLTGRAESWFRTSGLQGGSWTEVRREFLDFFLLPRYYQRESDRISKGRTNRSRNTSSIFAFRCAAPGSHQKKSWSVCVKACYQSTRYSRAPKTFGRLPNSPTWWSPAAEEAGLAEDIWTPRTHLIAPAECT